MWSPAGLATPAFVGTGRHKGVAKSLSSRTRPEMATFNAIDVETANADRASICQIGIVHVQDGVVVDRWQTLVNPEDWFDPWNVGTQDTSKLMGYEKSTKHRKAEGLIDKGADIQILSESEFSDLVGGF